MNLKRKVQSLEPTPMISFFVTTLKVRSLRRSQHFKLWFVSSWWNFGRWNTAKWASESWCRNRKHFNQYFSPMQLAPVILKHQPVIQHLLCSYVNLDLYPAEPKDISNISSFWESKHWDWQWRSGRGLCRSSISRGQHPFSRKRRPHKRMKHWPWMRCTLQAQFFSSLFIFGTKKPQICHDPAGLTFLFQLSSTLNEHERCFCVCVCVCVWNPDLTVAGKACLENWKRVISGVFTHRFLAIWPLLDQQVIISPNFHQREWKGSGWWRFFLLVDRPLQALNNNPGDDILTFTVFELLYGNHFTSILQIQKRYVVVVRRNQALRCTQYDLFLDPEDCLKRQNPGDLCNNTTFMIKRMNEISWPTGLHQTPQNVHC